MGIIYGSNSTKINKLNLNQTIIVIFKIQLDYLILMLFTILFQNYPIWYINIIYIKIKNFELIKQTYLHDKIYKLLNV